MRIPSESKTVRTAEDWPCWRGPGGDNNSAWVPQTLPPQAKPRWKAAMSGAAHSGVVISGGRVVVMDHEKDAQDIVRCLKAETGQEVWKYQIRQQRQTDNLGLLPTSHAGDFGRGRLHTWRAGHSAPSTSKAGACYGKRS
ncbi:MAG: PQQ-binding-like beta-propeller repeat protein [Thermoguttaceae bacterium]